MATSDACATRSVAWHYRASAWEQWWASHIADIRKWHPDGCEALCQGACAKVVSNSSHFITAWLSLQRARETSAAGRHVRDEHAAGLHPFLSYFRGVSACSGRVSMVPIEPLVGALRHPHHDCVKRSSARASKAYLLPAWSAEVLPAPRRRFFFDCGASLYRSGSGGASQQWFVDGYARRGLAFDRTLAWEFENHTDAAIRRPLPPALRAATTIYRHPADAPPGRLVSDRLSYFNFGIDGVRGSARNPLEHLRALAAPDDFVVFKLDVDSPAIELALVEQILADPGTARLIDEFYWEHVVAGSPMQSFGWGHDLRRQAARGEALQSLDDSYAYFGRLRRMGIRAHSWV
mmetsp:Transcript_8096/g.25701  ORF Transcript_8096/g.25701 Transcript_8096/m.25701 type:complete len:348 (+) Transcript_8096:89-1132(+)